MYSRVCPHVAVTHYLFICLCVCSRMDNQVRMTFTSSLCRLYQVSSVSARLSPSLYVIRCKSGETERRRLSSWHNYDMIQSHFFSTIHSGWLKGHVMCMGVEEIGRCAKVTDVFLLLFFFFFLVGAKEGGRELFDDPSYVNVDKPRPPVAANGNAHRDAFDMSKCLTRSIYVVLGISCQLDKSS